MIRLSFIALVIIMLLSLICSGCFESDSSSQGDVESIVVSGDGVSRVIDRPDESIRLVVSGFNCIVTVSMQTNLTEVDLTGDDNIVRVSRNHSFISTISGENSVINYYD